MTYSHAAGQMDYQGKSFLAGPAQPHEAARMASELLLAFETQEVKVLSLALATVWFVL